MGEIRERKKRAIAVAVFDTGVAPVDDLTMPRNRLAAFRDEINGMSEPYDDNGHGTHVAGLIGGNGYRSGGTRVGAAPRCLIIGVKILDARGRGGVSEALAGIRWMMSVREKYNIRVANLSIGARHSGAGDVIVRAAESMWDAGVVVVTAAGNLGPEPGSVTSPGTSRKVITVGCLEDGLRSGRGPTPDCVVKPDLLAPGLNRVSCLTNTPLSPDRRREIARESGYYARMSGTSMAAPAISGRAAVMLELDPGLTPDQVKAALMREAGGADYTPTVHSDGVYEYDTACLAERHIARTNAAALIGVLALASRR
ncbi:MAG: S8 family peptidase [Clostridiales bacterium]|nr:S8 family peptidase [Clostridiales bacterium]